MAVLDNYLLKIRYVLPQGRTELNRMQLGNLHKSFRIMPIYVKNWSLLLAFLQLHMSLVLLRVCKNGAFLHVCLLLSYVVGGRLLRRFFLYLYINGLHFSFKFNLIAFYLWNLWMSQNERLLTNRLVQKNCDIHNWTLLLEESGLPLSTQFGTGAILNYLTINIASWVLTWFPHV